MTRLTVYRHFADMDEVFTACMAHWLSAHPAPDPGPWLTIEGFEARARRVLTDVYRWYEDVGHELYPVYRDIDSVPASRALSSRSGAIRSRASSWARTCRAAAPDHACGRSPCTSSGS